MWNWKRLLKKQRKLFLQLKRCGLDILFFPSVILCALLDTTRLTGPERGSLKELFVSFSQWWSSVRLRRGRGSGRERIL